MPSNTYINLDHYMHTVAMPQSYHFEGINASHDLLMASLNQAQGCQQLQNSGHGSEDKHLQHACVSTLQEEVVHLKGLSHRWDTSELTVGYYINCTSPSGVRRILHSKPIHVTHNL